jgi:hypothetical protein
MEANQAAVSARKCLGGDNAEKFYFGLKPSRQSKVSTRAMISRFRPTPNVQGKAVRSRGTPEAPLVADSRR